MNDIKNALFSMADEKYKNFSEKLAMSKKELIGVRLPQIKKLAKKLASFEDPLSLIDTEYFEEIMLRGFVIAFLKKDLNDKLHLIKEHLTYIDNWSCCDSFCAALKIKDTDKKAFFEYLKNFLHNEDEFLVRFAIVMLLDHFIEDEFIDSILNILSDIRHPGYYVKMAVGWAVSICFIKQREKTLVFLKNSPLDAFTHNKAISKIRDSFRVSAEDKDLLKTLCK